MNVSLPRSGENDPLFKSHATEIFNVIGGASATEIAKAKQQADKIFKSDSTQLQGDDVIIWNKMRINFLLKKDPLPHDIEQFKNLFDSVKKIEVMSDNEKTKLYKRLESMFRGIEHVDTDEAWMQRADILDAMDVLMQKYPDLEPLKAVPNPEGEQWRPDTIPLVPQHKVKTAVDSYKADDTEKKTVQSLKTVMGDKLTGEYTGAAKMVQKLTSRNSSLFRLFYKLIARVVTKFMGVTKRLEITEPRRAKKISSTSRGLGITSTEVLIRKTKNVTNIKRNEKEKWVEEYRGPRFLFGQSIREFKNFNEWFKRDLSDEARVLYLEGAVAKEEKLTAKFGPPEQGENRVVVSNSDSRHRYESLAPNEFGNAQMISGKVLNEEGVEVAKSSGDSSEYYEDSYAFTNKNLFGRTNNDPIEPVALPTNQVVELKSRTNELKVIKEYDQDPTKAIAKIKKNKDCKKVIVAAQHELLGSMYRLFDQTGLALNQKFSLEIQTYDSSGVVLMNKFYSWRVLQIKEKRREMTTDE